MRRVSLVSSAPCICNISALRKSLSLPSRPSSTTFCAALTRSWVISHSTPALARQMSQTLRAASMATLLGVEMDQLRDKSVPLKALPQSVLRDVFEQMKGAKDAVTTFADLQKCLAPLWHSARPDQHPFGRMITAWSRALMVNAAFSQTRRSVRQVQRRVKTSPRTRATLINPLWDGMCSHKQDSRP